jgi:DNA-binding MarR family transcriptional regulator
VRRCPDPADRRVVRLQLTDTARRRVEQWRDARIAVVTDALSGIDAADRAAIRQAIPALNRLANQLRPEEDS